MFRCSKPQWGTITRQSGWLLSKSLQPRFKKQRHYFANKYPSSQSYGFSNSHAWMWELNYKESWALKNWCFWLWCWRRLLRFPWTTKSSNQSVLKEISPEYSLRDWWWSWNSNTLATWCKELTHLKRPWCWERLKAGGEGDDGWWDCWNHWLYGHEFE